MSHHDKRGRTYSDIRECKTTRRSITAPIICPGGYPVKVGFRSPETSRYLVGMRVDAGEIGIRREMYWGWMQRNEFIEAGSRREKVDTRQSR